MICTKNVFGKFVKMIRGETNLAYYYAILIERHIVYTLIAPPRGQMLSELASKHIAGAQHDPMLQQSGGTCTCRQD